MTSPGRASMVPPRVRFVQMGQLDDAIRDHLELLRRRGADPTDIARAEAEALGPAVREVSEPDAHEEADDLLAGTAPPPAVDADGFAGDDPEADEDFADGDEADGDGSGPEEFESENDSLEHGEAGHDQPTEMFDAFADDEAAEEVAESEGDIDDPALRSHDAATGDEVDQDDVGSTGESSAPSSLADADVLEETPDFLAESPDHDKLWFEQSGPRDFDFDGDK